MRFYLAAALERAEELRVYRERLVALGHDVTSRWLEPEHQQHDEKTCARIDLDDILRSDTVVSFTGAGGRGGRHVEFGFAEALGKAQVVVGRREHVFHHLPNVRQYDTFDDFIDEIRNT